MGCKNWLRWVKGGVLFFVISVVGMVLGVIITSLIDFTSSI